MYPIISDGNGAKTVEMDGRVHRLDSSEAMAEAKAAIGSRGGYDVELTQDEANALAKDQTGRDALFTRLVQHRLAEWIELAEERLADSDIRVYVTGGNDDSVEMLEPLVSAGSERVVASEDRVVEVNVNGVDGGLAGHVPARYAELPESAYLTCTPISAARRWLGVIFADREGEDFPLDDGERETMMTLGRLAALTASVEHSTEQRESERRLAERVELTRDLHENAIQRLFGVALALGSEDDLTKKERERCQEELRSVVADLRRALTRPLETPERASKACLGELLERLDERRPELAVEWGDGVEVPLDFEPVAQLVLNEALRNVDRHSRPKEILVRVASDGTTFSISIENDGAGDGRSTRGSGLGLRLAALEALRYEGLVEFGSLDDNRWRVRLVVPVGDR